MCILRDHRFKGSDKMDFAFATVAILVLGLIALTAMLICCGDERDRVAQGVRTILKAVARLLR